MHGGHDSVVQPEDSLRFGEALRAAGNRTDFILFPGARHAFIVTNYTASEAEIVRALWVTDKFLCSLAWSFTSSQSVRGVWPCGLRDGQGEPVHPQFHQGSTGD